MRKPGGRGLLLPVLAGGATLSIFSAMVWMFVFDDSGDPLENADRLASVGAFLLAAIG